MSGGYPVPGEEAACLFEGALTGWGGAAVRLCCTLGT